jgi:kumamolisin
MPQRQVKCHPYIKFSAKTSTTWSVPALCAAYNWPSKLAGGGVIAIVELGGGWTQSDMQQFFSSINQPVPSITDVSVDGTVNSQQNPQNDADMEVALDIQVAGAAYYMATGKAATIRVYWAQDIAPAVTKAMQDGCDVCTISWGADEASWGNAACYEMQAAATAAVTKGMVIFAAAGDNDSSDGGDDSANVDCPGSCPSIVCCGGTTKTATSEVVWNNDPNETNGEGTGGGYSAVFGMPGWQSAFGAPPAPASEPDEKNPGKGRMVPDVSANADPETGYQIVVYGEQQIVGGTSAVAPLYAGLFASFGKKLGFVGERVWIKANQSAFNDVIIGNNGDYSAAPGPDPASGVGTPIGTKLAAIFVH